MRPRDLVDYVLLAALWGGSFLLTRIAVAEFGPLALAFLRCAGAALLLALYLAWRGQAQALRGSFARTGPIGIVGSAMPFALLGYGLVSLSSGLGLDPERDHADVHGAGRLVLAPRAPAASARRRHRHRLRRRGRPRVAALRRQQRLAARPRLPRFDFLLRDRGQCDAPPPRRRGAGGIGDRSQIGASLALAPFAALAWPAATPSLLAWVGALGLASLCTALAYLLYFRLIKHAGAQRASTVTYLIPLFGILWGAWLLGERLDGRQFVGGVVIIVGSALAIGLGAPAQARPGPAAPAGRLGRTADGSGDGIAHRAGADRAAARLRRCPPVRKPCASTARTARSTRSAASARPKEWRSIIATDRIAASGLAMSLPAMSGAVPCTGSYRPLVPSPSEADGSMPIEPVSIAAASDRMSPNMLPVTMTSNCFGARISCIAAASTKRCVSSTSGYSCADARDHLAPELHRLEHVGLVHRAELAPARARGAEGDVRDALDLGLACSAWC